MSELEDRDIDQILIQEDVAIVDVAIFHLRLVNF